MAELRRSAAARSPSFLPGEDLTAASGSYDVHTAHHSVQAELQRLAAQARSGWEKEARVLSWFGVRDGQSILELGSGPGYYGGPVATL